MPQLRYSTFDGVVHTHELGPGTTRIGRTPDNDLQIDELTVSSHHCELRWVDGTMVVKDLDSITGTYVDGEPVTERVIQVGQSLSLGTLLVGVKDSAGGAVVEPDPTTELRSVPLEDGSYSCLRHRQARAIFQCPECFDLACRDCVDLVGSKDPAEEVACRACGAKGERIDWSGLTMSKKEALVRLLPSPVQKAVNLWAKRGNDRPGRESR